MGQVEPTDFVSDVCLSSPLVIPWQRHRSAPLAEEVRQLPLGLRGPQRSPYSALSGLAFHGLDHEKSI